MSFIIGLWDCGAHFRLFSADGEPSAWNRFEYSEFLINYEGGFVRRGLLGQLLYSFTLHSGIDKETLRWIVVGISVVCYIIVFVWYLMLARRAPFSWWIVMIGVMTSAVAIVRKDFFGMAGLLLVYSLLQTPTPWRRFWAVVIVVVELLCHEAFFFWGVPLFLLLLAQDFKVHKINLFYILLVLGTFGVACYFKGTERITEAIFASWENAAGINLDHGKMSTTIGSLTWGTLETARMHALCNFYNDGSWGIAPPLLRFLQFIAVYWLVTGFVYRFNTSRLLSSESFRTGFCTLFLFQGLCMLPMFLVLSCDYIRLYQYICFATFSGYFLLGGDRLHRLFPTFMFRVTRWINKWLDRVVPPRRGLLILGLLFIGVNPWHFNVAGDFFHSPVGTVLEWVKTPK